MTTDLPKLSGLPPRAVWRARGGRLWPIQNQKPPGWFLLGAVDSAEKVVGRARSCLVLPGPARSCRPLRGSRCFRPAPGCWLGGAARGPLAGGWGCGPRGGALAWRLWARRGGWRFWPFPGRSTAYSALTG